MDVNCQSSLTTPLHWAAMEGKTSSVSTLLSLGADFRARDAKKFVPLTLAIGGQHVECVRLLMEKDSLATFEMNTLVFARTPAMKETLCGLFKSLWNLTLYLPGTN